MNTTSRGETYERLVLSVVRQKLADGELGLLPEACTLHHRKGYFSRDRQKQIICDISIELHLAGLTNWSLLWVWECKDLANKVPVDDVEEFWAKLQQITGVNVKGAVVSSTGFQDGASQFARSKGIALVEFRSQSPSLFLFGASGSGKSALARAGIQPAKTDSETTEGTNAPPDSLDESGNTNDKRFFGETSDLPLILEGLLGDTFSAQVDQHQFLNWNDFLECLLTDAKNV